MSAIEAMSVSVEFTEGDADNPVVINLHTVDPDKERNNHVWMIGIVSLVKGMASNLGITADEMWDMITDFREQSEPDWEDCAHDNLN
jgi:hypothetical protein